MCQMSYHLEGLSGSELEALRLCSLQSEFDEAVKTDDQHTYLMAFDQITPGYYFVTNTAMEWLLSCVDYHVSL